MTRGPLPSAPGSGGPGILFWLNVAYQALPPIARLALAKNVRGWAEKAERDAVAEMSAEPWASHPAAYDTTGQTRP